MGEVKIPCAFYYYLHSMIYEKAQGKMISPKEAKSCLFQWKIPSEIREIILKELEMLGLIRKINRLLIEISPPLYCDQQIKKFNIELGIWK